jgi:photosystem II stability/assembly factor-like uncharacterized protein
MFSLPIAARVLVLLLAVTRSATAQWISQSSGTDAELRGLSVVSLNVAWGSGQRGSIVRTTDGGRHWVADTVPTATKLDLRAIAATSANVAHALSIADSGRIFRTSDGGRTWSQRFMSLRKGSFFDAIRFWDARHGIAVSDPVDGRFLLVATNDGGDSWKELPGAGMPAALPNEGAFAASGSCLTVYGSSDVWFVTGGASVARIFHSANRGKSWTVRDTPIRAGGASEGNFSVAFRDAKHGVIVGGDYQKPKLGGRNVALTSDGGVTWTLVDSASSPSGFKSAVAYVPGSGGKKLVAVGLSGTDESSDGGLTWTATDTVAYNSVQFAGSGGYAVGPKGRVGRNSIEKH